jgi:hypothetical protein
MKSFVEKRSRKKAAPAWLPVGSVSWSTPFTCVALQFTVRRDVGAGGAKSSSRTFVYPPLEMITLQLTPARSEPPTTEATRKLFTVDPRSRATVAPVALPPAVERRVLFL